MTRPKPIGGTLVLSDEERGALVKSVDWCPYCDKHEDECEAWHEDADPEAVLSGLRVIRLQQLRKEFLYAREAFADAYDAMIAGVIWYDDAAKAQLEQVAASVRVSEPEDAARYDGFKEQGIEAALRARRHIIARDFNEFDPQRADMLWKLQNGGAL